MREIQRLIGAGALLAAVLLWTPGCQRPRGPAASEQAKEHEHSHKPKMEHDHAEEGPHGGALGEAADEKYHAEFTVDHAKKQTTVYILDSTAKKPAPIAAQSVTLTLTDVKPHVQITLKADPEKGDPQGMSSRFIGTNDELGKEREFKGEIAGQVGDTPWIWKFEEKEHDHKHDKKK